MVSCELLPGRPGQRLLAANESEAGLGYARASRYCDHKQHGLRPDGEGWQGGGLMGETALVAVSLLLHSYCSLLGQTG